MDGVQQGKEDARLWWEPWELSEGQIIEVLERINPEHFGIIMHNSIAEVYFTNTSDLPFRNIARLCKSRGIPFVGEGFFGGSGEDVEGLTHIACSRLVFQQLNAMKNAAGLTGIKEYYGLCPAHFSVNTEMFKQYLRHPEKGMEKLLESIALTWSKDTAALQEAWENVAYGMELFPYNASWWLRFLVSRPQTQEWTRIKAEDWKLRRGNPAGEVFT